MTMRCCVAALCVSALTTSLLVAAAADDTRQDAPAQAENEVEITEEDKRAWSNLHGGGGWGKRAWQDLNSAWGKRAWQDLNTAWGKRAWQDLNSAWGKRGWQDLNSAWGKRGWQDLNSAWGKRAWQDMYQTPWGKRGWQDMSSAWGKRAPEKWSNFHGSWGKRASGPDYVDDVPAMLHQLITLQQLEAEAERPGAGLEMEVPDKKAWSSLHGAWGKRPMKPVPMNSGSYYWKRQPGWTNLRGMWGKRSPAWDSELDDVTDTHEGSDPPQGDN